MSTLHKYYGRRLTALFGTVLLATLALDQLHTTLVKHQAATWLPDITNLQSHRAVLGVVLLLGGEFYPKVAVATQRPELDFGGTGAGSRHIRNAGSMVRERSPRPLSTKLISSRTV